MNNFEKSISLPEINKENEMHGIPEGDNKKEEPQPWLDMNREESYDKVNMMFADIQDGLTDYGIQNWLRELANQHIGEDAINKIKSEEVESLKYLNFTSESASQVAGKEIKRPVLLFSNIGEYQNFSIKLRGESSAASRGMNIPGSVFSQGDLQKTGLIIATDNKEFINHEIFHSIDPNSEKRQGYDRILNEMFAYYQQIIVEANSKHYSHLANPEDGPWGTLSRTIDESYINNYLEDFKDINARLSKEELDKLMKEIVSAIRLVYEKKGHLEAQRTIAKSNTIEELFNKAK